MGEIITPQKDMWIPKNYSVFIRPTEYQLSQRKMEGYRKFAEIKNYYQRNPVKFIEEILGAKLFDAQAYCVESSWATPYVLWVCSRGYGKSTLIDLVLMAKSMLYNNYISYIAAGSSEQSIQTFQTLIRLANQAVESMTGLTNAFKEQVEIKNASGDGSDAVHSESNICSYELLWRKIGEVLTDNTELTILIAQGKMEM